MCIEKDKCRWVIYNWLVPDKRPIPQPGFPEQPVHLLDVAPAPEGENGCKGEIGFAMRAVSGEVAGIQKIELRTLLSRASL